MLFGIGDHVPVIPFDEVVGKSGIGVPKQYGPIGLNVGKMFSLISICISVFNAHCPDVGVK